MLSSVGNLVGTVSQLLLDSPQVLLEGVNQVFGSYVSSDLEQLQNVGFDLWPVKASHVALQLLKFCLHLWHLACSLCPAVDFLLRRSNSTGVGRSTAASSVDPLNLEFEIDDVVAVLLYLGDLVFAFGDALDELLFGPRDQGLQFCNGITTDLFLLSLIFLFFALIWRLEVSGCKLLLELFNFFGISLATLSVGVNLLDVRVQVVFQSLGQLLEVLHSAVEATLFLDEVVESVLPDKVFQLLLGIILDIVSDFIDGPEEQSDLVFTHVWTRHDASDLVVGFELPQPVVEVFNFSKI